MSSRGSQSDGLVRASIIIEPWRGGRIMSQRLLFKNKGECAGSGDPTAVTLRNRRLEVAGMRLGSRRRSGGVPDLGSVSWDIYWAVEGFPPLPQMER